MKKILLGFCLIILALCGQAQGLEKIIVEKYYVADANDAAYATSSGATNLPVGSVTWRLYVDLAPDWYLVSVYGSTDHPLTINTTTSFYNDLSYGAESPSFNTTKTKKGTTMIDSWLSTGYACAGYLGVLKSEDNGVGTFVNTTTPTKVLQNNDASAGIALTVQDGLIAGTICPISIVNINTDAISDGTIVGNTVSTTTGSWYSTSTSPRTQGAFPGGSNRVLIGQFTTSGTFHYEINVVVGKDLGGGKSAAEYYVVSNPQSGEISGAQYNLTGTLSPASALPTCSITTPTAGQTFYVGNVIPITANAADADGTIAKVVYYINGAKIDSSATTPWQINWTGIAGSVAITAIAYDFEGNHTTSAPVNITVVANAAPTVSITAPPVGDTILLGKDTKVVSITANAADDGAVAKVEFFIDDVSRGTVTAAPYQINWKVKADSTALNIHKIKAIATDNMGTSTTSAIDSVWLLRDRPPSVSISKPANGAQLKLDTTYLIAATATDPDGAVVKVEFYVGAGLKIGEAASAPYQCNWKCSGTLGQSNITAKATDNAGLETSSSIGITIIQNNYNPTVSITVPLANASFAVGETVAINANAADADGSVASVEFLVDNVHLITDNTSPYTANYTGVLGIHTLTAKATDDKGAIATSSVSITVKNNTPPTVSITAPSASASYKVGQAFAITANADDPDGTVVSVEFFVDNVSVGVDSIAPYTASYTSYTKGSHNITAQVTDNRGAKTVSDPILINISETTPPTVSITAPAANASSKVGQTVAITADAADTDGTVVAVEFFIDDVSVGIDSTTPYTHNYIGVLGTHTITAKATDNDGAHTISSSVTINIIPTGINDIKQTVAFKVYPNPSKDLITLDITAFKLSRDISYKIINMEGQVIIDKAIGAIADNYIENINISSLPKGLYTIALSTDGNTLYQRIIKQ